MGMRGGVILAGGQNRRLGGEQKALLRFGTETLIERQVRIMRNICSEIIVVTDEPKPFLKVLDRDIRIITDYLPAHGPLVGVHAGLMLSTLNLVWIVGCDMPHIDPKAAEILFERVEQGAQAAIPNVGGGLFPLHGVYHRSCAAAAEQLVKQGTASMSALLKEIDWTEVKDEEFFKAGVPRNFVESIDTIDDYEREAALMKAET
jgi:molybdopterin-guanine dinucleotide biosynthesis protein A